MPDTTGTPPPNTGPGAWCDLHQGPSGTAAPVQITARTSGPDHTLYACAPCRDVRGLTPAEPAPDEVAYREFLDHSATCTSCGRPGRCATGQALWNTYRERLVTA
ncbi:hypothetical protein ACIPJG_25020 [Streptomyces halstedii]|uniref:hypothetical protein n=1 Tax=Streptomyces halstedii TaxID=1944 RepID=UPI0038181D30